MGQYSDYLRYSKTRDILVICSPIIGFWFNISDNFEVSVMCTRPVEYLGTSMRGTSMRGTRFMLEIEIEEKYLDLMFSPSREIQRLGVLSFLATLVSPVKYFESSDCQ